MLKKTAEYLNFIRTLHPEKHSEVSQAVLSKFAGSFEQDCKLPANLLKTACETPESEVEKFKNLVVLTH